ncbi:hypothetical protein EDD37DRAFT_677809 [Exophiala viscosa]|uniref:uncharacterized protein n=1 Tax=Exophiala viscosa TaxID=2486360 RepID=UPI0021936A8E|nr:hypothetical protein EDD37DRAFT_677809 [Exophiala viscosa]
MSQGQSPIIFIDANPSSRSARFQNLTRSHARAHAARISHPKNRQYSRPYPASNTSEDDQDEAMAPLSTTVSLFKGNRDPFNAGAVNCSPLEYAVLNRLRTLMVSFTWSSELSMRKNGATLTSQFYGSFNLISESATTHASVSAAMYMWDTDRRIQGRPSGDVNLAGDKHHGQALRALRQLLEANYAAKSFEELEQIKNTALTLGNCAFYSGRIIQLMGGSEALPRLQLEMDVYGLLNISIVVGCRPLIASSEFDPGPLSGSPHLSSLVRSCVDDRGPSTKKSVASAMSPTLMATHAEIRELLDVQGAKFKYASSAAKEVESLFRWSHLRWMAARTRLFEHWRDLADATIDGSTNNQLDLALCQPTMLFERCIFEDMHSLEMRFQLTRLTYAMVVASLHGMKPEFDITQAATDTRKYDLLWIYSVGA